MKCTVTRFATFISRCGHTELCCHGDKFTVLTMGSTSVI